MKYLRLFRDRYHEYRFEIRHITVLALVLIVFQFFVLFMNQNSLRKVFVKSQQWYQQDAAERIANLTATSIEMLFESKSPKAKLSESEERKIIQDFNIIFSQQLLDKNVQSVCILIPYENTIVSIDDGKQLCNYLFGDAKSVRNSDSTHAEAIRLFRSVQDTIRKIEQNYTLVERQHIFHVFIPFVPRGEFVGVVYMKTSPDLTFLTEEMSTNYNQTALVYSALIIIGLLAMFYISTRTLAERNEAQRLLFEEQKQHLTEQINHQKEMLFTKRIYHTHHKAEKIGGFIKEDLRNLTADNINFIKNRISRYASFIARVIYDMKWYDPPIHTIRGPMFKTNVNEVIKFIVENIFQRLSDNRPATKFNLQLDPLLPDVAINEYVIWEVFEPIIQNSMDHAGVDKKVITIKTEFNPVLRQSTIMIADNGNGIPLGLLESDEHGVKKIFQEQVTSGDITGKEHSGYGCYIAYEIATQRFGWKINAENLPEGGCRFVFIVQH
ncbi:MAG: ATP-binding protein [Bacteroidota bacterium]